MIQEPTKHFEDEDITIYKVVVGPIDNNVFYMQCRRTGEAVMIDAANEHDLLLELCRRFNVRTILETHGHWDHIGAVEEVRNAGYEVGVVAEDADMLPNYDYLLEDDTVVKVGESALELITTPGHTPGSICFKVRDKPLLFSGDTLFPGGPGRTDLPGGDFQTVLTSIDSKILTLEANTVVMPGHGGDTSVAAERVNFPAWLNRGW